MGDSLKALADDYQEYWICKGLGVKPNRSVGDSPFYDHWEELKNKPITREEVIKRIDERLDTGKDGAMTAASLEGLKQAMHFAPNDLCYALDDRSLKVLGEKKEKMSNRYNHIKGLKYVEVTLPTSVQKFLEDGHVQTLPDGEQILIPYGVFVKSASGQKYKMVDTGYLKRVDTFKQHTLALDVLKWGPEEMKEGARDYLRTLGYPDDQLV